MIVWLITYELETVWEEAVIIEVELLSCSFPGMTEENN
jgi:hypothetical protein